MSQGRNVIQSENKTALIKDQARKLKHKHTQKPDKLAGFPSSWKRQGNYLIAALTCWLRIIVVHDVVSTVEFIL